MDIEQANQVADVLNRDFNMDIEVLDDYSGRGMYGAEVAAFVLDDGDELFVGYAFGMLGVSEDDMPSRFDNMGLRVVLY